MHGYIHSPSGRHPPGQTPPPPTATAADGTHPTGMHFLFTLDFSKNGTRSVPILCKRNQVVWNRKIPKHTWTFPLFFRRCWHHCPKSLMGSSSSTQGETKAHLYHKNSDLLLADIGNLQPEHEMSKISKCQKYHSPSYAPCSHASLYAPSYGPLLFPRFHKKIQILNSITRQKVALLLAFLLSHWSGAY